MKKINSIKIKSALISVSNKDGIVPFVKALHQMDVQILSTGGTGTLIKNNKIPLTFVSDYTNSPELLGNRVKTLHPKIHGGLLYLRDDSSHQADIQKQGIIPIDMLVINLYPFEKISKDKKNSFNKIIENIDIGGPAMLRSGAKNSRFVCVLSDPKDYDSVLIEMRQNNGHLSESTLQKFSQKAFFKTAQYDLAIANFLSNGKYTGKTFEKIQELSYGENPHQKASLYKSSHTSESSLVNAIQKQGKKLSFNNILDTQSALEILKEFKEKTAVIVKHNNPCGVARSSSLLNAFKKAYSVDPQSSFGSVIAFNDIVDKSTAQEIMSHFVEVIIAPDFHKEALEVFSEKKNLRILSLKNFQTHRDPEEKDFKKIVGGFLIQDRDIHTRDIEDWKVVTERKPSQQEKDALLFNWKVCKHVKSNAIVYGLKDRILGVGSGQMSRIDSIRFGAQKSLSDLKGAVIASDAFFPFSDSIEHIKNFSISAIIQPGGSIKDLEVIEACNHYHIAMVFTGRRHFKH